MSAASRQRLAGDAAISFGKAVLRRFVIGCGAAVVVYVVLSGQHRTAFTSPAAPTVAECDALIASGRVDTCRVVRPFDETPDGGR